MQGGTKVIIKLIGKEFIFYRILYFLRNLHFSSYTESFVIFTKIVKWNTQKNGKKHVN